MSGDSHVRVGILTSGGLAPCLSSALGFLIIKYQQMCPDAEIICYLNGYRGLLLGDSIKVTPEIRKQARSLHHHGGSPIGNSRVKLVNVEDCLKRELIHEGQHPQRVAAEQLIRDEVTILHTIGGDDTNTAACRLAHFLADNFGDYKLTVVGLPKTIDNDVFPIRQTLGCITAAEQGARFFSNVVAEHSASPRMLIIHEIMGRHCGWLAAATARIYKEGLEQKESLPDFGVSNKRTDIHALFIPEMEIDFEEEVKRLRDVMDRCGTVNIFLSEGAGIPDIIREKQKQGEEVERDAFGHLKLDKIKPGVWFGKQFASMLHAEKVLVQKSGYFCRAAPSNDEDLELIQKCVDLAVESALKGESGVPGHDIEQDNELRLIEFDRIRGGKVFNIDEEWFSNLMDAMGQQKRGPPKPPKEDVKPRPKLKSKPKQLPASFSGGAPHLSLPDRKAGMRHRASLVTVNNALRTTSPLEVQAITEIVSSRYGDDKQTTQSLSLVLSSLFVACKDISKECNKTGVFESIYGDHDIVGQRLNFLANNIMTNHLRLTQQISSMCSQENDDPVIISRAPNAHFCCVFDPLDGVQNIDANVSVGTIFGIYRSSPINGTDPEVARKDLMRKASDLIMAGYCMYGAATLLVLTAGAGTGVHGFTLDNSRNEFVLTNENIKIPAKGHIYSVNEGNFDDWDVASREYVRRCKLLQRGARRSLRYIGSMTSDVHRTLTYGGIFMYPADRRNPRGKLGLVYECGPMAFVICEAGGKASTGTQNILDIKPEDLHQKVPLYMGSGGSVREVEDLYVELDPAVHDV